MPLAVLLLSLLSSSACSGLLLHSCSSRLASAVTDSPAAVVCAADKAVDECLWERKEKEEEEDGGARPRVTCRVRSDIRVAGSAKGVTCSKSLGRTVCRLRLSASAAASLGGEWTVKVLRHQGLTHWPNPVVSARATVTVGVVPRDVFRRRGGKEKEEEEEEARDACFSSDTDYPGHDLPGGGQVAGVGGVSRCQVLCQRRSPCRYWTWSPPDNCFLKTARGEEKAAAGFVSGEKTCDPRRNPRAGFDGEEDSVRIGTSAGAAATTDVNSNGNGIATSTEISSLSYSLIGSAAGLAVFAAFAFFVLRNPPWREETARKKKVGGLPPSDLVRLENERGEEDEGEDGQDDDDDNDEGEGELELPRVATHKKPTRKLTAKSPPKSEFSRLCEADRGRNLIRNTKNSAQKHIRLNRCGHSVPFDESRVTLSNGDYVNASWIPIPSHRGEGKGEELVIATQGPLLETVGDFWRMVTDNGVGTIVALANIEEKEKGRMVEKCARYWPEHVGGQESCGQFKVRMAEEKAEEMLGVKKRQLEVVDATVEQVHFTSWKEGEVPASTKQFFRFSAEFADSWRRKGRGRREERRLLVHCSDGGGRTGMFLALLATLLSGGDGSAMEEVLRLRSFRTGMVSSREQYSCLHKCLCLAQERAQVHSESRH